ncbi:MAG: phosphate/phosphite/phosphonate ABC transporter substrate-binding protein [Bacteroidota bacterium]
MKYLTWAILLSLIAGACAPPDDQGQLDELVIGLSISEDYDKTVGKIEALQSYLVQELNMDVKIFKVTNGSAVVEAIKADKIHLGSTGAFSYIIARSKTDITPLVTTAAAVEDTIHNYWSCLIVSSDSPINNIADLKQEKGNLTMAWAYPTSTSGHLVPRTYLRSQGILPEDFKEVMVSENHIASLYNCITGKIDVTVVNNTTIREYLRRGKIQPDEFKVIWESDPIPRGSIFASETLDDELTQKIQQALVNLYQKDSVAARRIHYRYDYPVKYIAVDDTYYDSLRAMARAIALIP